MEGLTPIGTVGSPRTFLKVKNGRIAMFNKESGDHEYMAGVYGKLNGITRRDVDHNGSVLRFFDIHILCGNNHFVLSVPMDSTMTAGLVNSLANIKDFGQEIHLMPWNTDPDDNGRCFTNVNVYMGRERKKENQVSWKCELPRVKKVPVGRQIITDDSERSAAVEALVKEINEAVSNASVANPQTPPITQPTALDGLDNGMDDEQF